MSSDVPGPAATEDDSDPSVDPREDRVWWATWIGLLLAAIGLVDGLVMAFKRRVAPCPDGTFFPEGADPTCYVHPQLGVGIGIAVMSVLLGILVVFASVLVRAVLKPSRPSANLPSSDRGG